MKRMRFGFVVSLLILVLGLSACRTGNQSGNTATPSGQGKSGPKDTLKVAWSAGVDLLDPDKTANGPDMMVLAQIYETLLGMDPNTRELVPKLATSWKAINDTTWQFKLREGVKFQNGEPFNAEAVKFSIERNLDPKTNSPHRSQLLNIARVETPDPYTVNVITTVPMPVLPYRMQPNGGSGRVFIMPPGYVKEKGDDYAAEHPMGTGPYKLAKWAKGKSISFERNDEYWGTKPEFKNVELHFITETSTRVAALLTGEMDLIQRLPIDDIKRVEATKGLTVVEDPNGLVHVFFVDPTQKPMDNPKVRLAMAYAMNMQEIVDSLLQGKGRVLAVPVAPAVAQFNDTLKPVEHDAAKAKQLLQEAGLGNGFTLKTYISDGRYIADKAIYDAVNSQLKDVGITVDPQVMEWGRLIRMMAEKNAGPFYMIGWDYGEGDASKMDTLFQSTSNYSLWKLPRYDDLSAKANSEMDSAKRKQLWSEAQKLVYDERAFLASWQTPVLWGMSDNLNWESKFGDNILFVEVHSKAK